MNWRVMEIHTYWQTQNPEKPLFEDIAWSKPERRSLAGKLGIIGGNKHGFMAVASSYSEALGAGVGEVKVLLPDALKKTIPKHMTDVVFAEISSLANWSNAVLLIGDSGKNSQTAILYENFIKDYEGQLTVTRDAVDVLRSSSTDLVSRANTLLVMSFAQTQKLFQAIYYPKMLTFSMQLAQAVEALHKFTITYPVTIATFHQDNMIIAHNGQVTTTPWAKPMDIWSGKVASRAA